jgi:hypothetical protein
MEEGSERVQAIATINTHQVKDLVFVLCVFADILKCSGI